LLKVGGWRISGDIPSTGAYVLIAAPHTSNWDFVWTMAMAIVLRVRLNWMGKHTLFIPLIGPLLERWGGIPIRRHESGNRVALMAAQLCATEDMVLLVPAEGTRSRAEYWKSGFYRIASTAGVPIVLGFLDYARRRGGFGTTVRPSGDVRVDMATIRTFYAGCAGKYPQLSGPIRLREESAARVGEHLCKP
jgi:1-acyl-sn-glycerol-3-phosphate acyltransferase